MIPCTHCTTPLSPARLAYLAAEGDTQMDCPACRASGHKHGCCNCDDDPATLAACPAAHPYCHNCGAVNTANCCEANEPESCPHDRCIITADGHGAYCADCGETLA